MGPPRGRRVAIAAAALGIAMIAGPGAASWEMLLERWLIWKLDSRDFSDRLKAAGARENVKESTRTAVRGCGESMETLHP